MQSQRDAFDVIEARERLGHISNATFYELVGSGALKTFTVGTRRLVSHSAILDFIRRQEKKPIVLKPVAKRRCSQAG